MHFFLDLRNAIWRKNQSSWVCTCIHTRAVVTVVGLAIINHYAHSIRSHALFWDF